MIKSNELKIGNWVNYLGTPTQLLTGKQIDDNHTFVNPIPITPEILEKAGFIIDGDGFTFKKGRFSIHQPANWTGFCFCEGSLILREIKPLHQLQNIYFDLTDEELPVNFKDLTYQ